LDDEEEKLPNNPITTTEFAVMQLGLIGFSNTFDNVEAVTFLSLRFL